MSVIKDKVKEGLNSQKQESTPREEMVEFLMGTIKNGKNLTELKKNPYLAKKIRALVGDDYDPDKDKITQLVQFFENNPEIPPTVLTLNDSEIPGTVKRLKAQGMKRNFNDPNIPNRGLFDKYNLASMTADGLGNFAKPLMGGALRVGANLLSSVPTESDQLALLDYYAETLGMDPEEYREKSQFAKKAYAQLDSIRTHAVGHGIVSTVGSGIGAVAGAAVVPVVGGLGGSFGGDYVAGMGYNFVTGRESGDVINTMRPLVSRWADDMRELASAERYDDIDDIDGPPYTPIDRGNTKGGKPTKRRAA